MQLLHLQCCDCKVASSMLQMQNRSVRSATSLLQFQLHSKNCKFCIQQCNCCNYVADAAVFDFIQKFALIFDFNCKSNAENASTVSAETTFLAFEASLFAECTILLAATRTVSSASTASKMQPYRLILLLRCPCPDFA